MLGLLHMAADADQTFSRPMCCMAHILLKPILALKDLYVNILVSLGEESDKNARAMHWYLSRWGLLKENDYQTKSTVFKDCRDKKLMIVEKLTTS